jgi:hypothetical protein
MSTGEGFFDAPYWNLSQAAAWVVYRERRIVEQLEHAVAGQFGAIAMYPSIHSEAKDPLGTLSLLEKALTDGRLEALGRRESLTAPRDPIPSQEWKGLVLRPPHAYAEVDLAAQIEPWRDIIVRSADVKKLWRSPQEVAGRSRFDWTAIKRLHDELQATNPEFSQNELINEIQVAFEAKFSKSPPARSTIQNKIKSWRVS